jgi:pyruvate carboxylase
MRFLKEDPWERLASFRQAMPNTLLQMLLRSANAVGYTNYPDNVVRHFIKTAAQQGIDVFRIFDPLNWVDNMRVAMDEVASHQKIVEAAICYTGRLSDPHEDKYTLGYYVRLAKQLEAAGAHILAIKDMAGLCRPQDASLLFRTLKQEVGLPLHFHTHDTSGIAAASVLAAIEEGCHVVDAAMDALSGLTSQPSLGSLVEALKHTPKQSSLDGASIRMLSHYWEQVRQGYVAFESDIRAGTSDVYVHGMPGGQYTNLREQARALGIDDSRWGEVARAYADVNDLLGNIVKVTPSSKMVGDLALLMVTNGYTRAQIEAPDFDIPFPESVVQYFYGEMGQPYGGFPEALQRKVLKGRVPLTVRLGETIPPIDLDGERRRLAESLGRPISETDLASHLMYPKVFADFQRERSRFGDLSKLPTATFFYGLDVGQEVSIDLEKGKQLIVTYVAQGLVQEDGTRAVMFELNGQPRAIRVVDRSVVATKPLVKKAQLNNPAEVGAPMPGQVLAVQVVAGQRVNTGDLLLSMEAMKMETAVRAERSAEVLEVLVRPGQAVDAKDLLLVLKPI